MFEKRKIFGPLLISLTFIGLTFPAQAKVCGHVAALKGRVHKLLLKTKPQKVKRGSKVCEGETLRAGKDSYAKVVMPDKNVLTLKSESQLKISEYVFQPKKGKKKVIIDLIYGRVRSKVNQKYHGVQSFEVRTKSAVAGVRGTDFLTEFNAQSGEATVVTFEGLVEMGQLGPKGKITQRTMVRPGFTAKVKKNQPQKVKSRRLPASELKRFNQETRVEPTAKGAQLGKKNKAVFVKKDRLKALGQTLGKGHPKAPGSRKRQFGFKGQKSKLGQGPSGPSGDRFGSIRGPQRRPSSRIPQRLKSQPPVPPPGSGAAPPPPSGMSPPPPPP